MRPGENQYYLFIHCTLDDRIFTWEQLQSLPSGMEGNTRNCKKYIIENGQQNIPSIARSASWQRCVTISLCTINPPQPLKVRTRQTVLAQKIQHSDFCSLQKAAIALRSIATVESAGGIVTWLTVACILLGLVLTL